MNVAPGTPARKENAMATMMLQAAVLSAAQPCNARVLAICCDVSPLHAFAYLLTGWVLCD